MLAARWCSVNVPAIGWRARSWMRSNLGNTGSNGLCPVHPDVRKKPISQVSVLGKENLVGRRIISGNPGRVRPREDRMQCMRQRIVWGT